MVYAIEAICLGIFMVVATLTTTALQLPASPLHQAIADPLLRRLLIGIVTVPGAAGEFAAFGAEFLLSFGLMTLVLQVSNRPRISQLTGLFSGILLTTYITFEAPLSGMSMNPARTLASALPAGVWHGFWIYWIAPPLGMQLAAEVYLRFGKKKNRNQICSKLCPNNSTECISPICCQRC